MLVKISCTRFRQNDIIFHDGLNVILGDDIASNSIGKSSLLMVIDFVFGGDDFIAKQPGTVKELGHHYYDAVFHFADEAFHFRRGTQSPGLVRYYDATFSKILKDYTIAEYTSWLNTKYGLSSDLSFRSRVSPLSRVWLKETLEVARPLQTVNREPAERQVDRALQMTSLYREISELSTRYKEAKVTQKAIRDAMRFSLIPKISAQTYKENIAELAALERRLLELKSNLAKFSISVQDAIQNEAGDLSIRKDSLLIERARHQVRIASLSRNLERLTAPPAAVYASITSVFPDIALSRLKEIEGFHQGVARIMEQEIFEALQEVAVQDKATTEAIADINRRFQTVAAKVAAPPEIIDGIVKSTSRIYNLMKENEVYNNAKAKTAEVKQCKTSLSEARQQKLSQASFLVNCTLEALSSEILGSDVSPPVFSITQTACTLQFQNDKGTGTAYIGLLLFDLAILLCTSSPFAIEDSLLFKNIEIMRMQRLIEKYSSVSKKQIFIALDEKGKYGPRTQTILVNSSVLSISRSNPLYDKDWRTTG